MKKQTTTEVMTVPMAPSIGFESTDVPVMAGDTVQDVIQRAKSVMGLPEADPSGRVHVWDATRSGDMTQLRPDLPAEQAFIADELVYLDDRFVAA